MLSYAQKCPIDSKPTSTSTSTSTLCTIKRKNLYFTYLSAKDYQKKLKKLLQTLENKNTAKFNVNAISLIFAAQTIILSLFLVSFSGYNRGEMN